MTFMFFESIGVDQEVVEVDDKEFIEIFAELVIHKVLERSGGVTQSKGHDAVLVQSIATAESSFPLLSHHHPQKMVTVAEVEA